MTDPFRIEGPTLWSFSGGRTSAYMLWRALQAFGGRLPDDHIVAFANTGKEREETLRFVYECGARWGVSIHWIEWRPFSAMEGDKLEPVEAQFEEVGFNSASRAGEPFGDLVRRKQFLPNVQMRYCTTKLKVEPMKRFMLAQGFERWTNPVGLRFDEGHRILRQKHRNETKKERYQAAWPLGLAKITKADVMRFWLGEGGRFPSPDLPQGFDLGLHDYEGNCDLCFLKGRGKKARIIRENPGIETWWSDIEASAKTIMPDAARFDRDESILQLAQSVRDQPLLIDDGFLEADDGDCTGWTCGGEDDAERRVLQRIFEKGL